MSPSGTLLVLQRNRVNTGDCCMKYIIAVIKPHKLEEVREALAGLGVQEIGRAHV